MAKVLTTTCKAHIRDDKTKSDLPVNQHTGDHWSVKGTVANEDDNSIMVKFFPAESKLNEIKGSFLESELSKFALDAYIMSAKKENDGTVNYNSYNGFYDIGVVRCLFKDFQDGRDPSGKYEFMGLESLKLPDM